MQAHPDFLPSQVTELFQLPDSGSRGGARNGKAKSVASSRLRHDERVDPDDFAADVHERAIQLDGYSTIQLLVFRSAESLELW